MFGPFKPTAALSGGLLWKIPWRLSAPQKLRHRRRMRRVDNVVSVLDSALQRHAASAVVTATRSSITDSLPTKAPNSLHTQKGSTKVTPEELSTTAEGQRMLNTEVNADLNERRHGRGPRQGDILSGSLPSGQVKMLGDEARANGTIKLIERWKAEMPTEAEMLPRDKYTMFDRKAKHYRKGVHKLPKWTRVSQRLNPPGF
ncbi:mitochondrial ribosomal protein L31-domain-containing protein [Delphinella strobiligena]|nr:mitochondrial ribosomal protein L31-domain-containing protein [Delphinella strobiligena]